METLTIKAYEGPAVLELSDPQPSDPQQPVESFVATLTDSGVHASTLIEVYEDYESGSDVSYLVALFDDLAANWQGWPDTKSWSAESWSDVEELLSLACTHDGLGHVTISVELRPWGDRTRWYVCGRLVIAASDLEELARAARTFLRM
jgi:Family of unknown function (DUF6228)